MNENAFGYLVEMGLSLLIAALLLSGVFTYSQISNKYHEKQLENHLASEEIKEQRNNLFYNNTHVYQQDVVSLIVRYKGDRSIIVMLNNGNHYKWTSTESSTTYKISAINNVLPKNVLYDANLLYGATGHNVIGYQFVEHQPGCGR